MKHMFRGLMLLALPGFGLGLPLAGCTDHQDGVTGTQSIGVELVVPAPEDVGDLQHRLPDGLRAITVNLSALDAAGEVDPTFDRDVEVYAQFLGTVTPTPTLDDFMLVAQNLVAVPLTKVHLTAGKAMNQTVTLPAVLGPTTLWIEDGPKPDKEGRIDPAYVPTYATGTSSTLWFREPTIADLQTPSSETPFDVRLLASPFDKKQVTVTTSRYGDVGRLVVTSVFAQGYTVSDAQCSDPGGAPPCTAKAYDHIEVFSFSAPRDQRGKLIQQGQVIDGFSGAMTEFNGLTEIGFPVTFASDDAVVPGRLPVPVTFDKDTWFKALTDPQGIINFERNEAAPIVVDNAKVCNLDNDYVRFGQWKLDPFGIGGDCAGNHNVINVVTAGVVAGLDPATLVGKTLPRVIGVLRPAFSIWIIFPRSAADLTLQ
jgi:hypothetical protein